MTEAEDNDYVSTREASKMLGVTARRLYDLIDKGELLAYKAGRCIVMRRRDVENLREAGEH